MERVNCDLCGADDAEPLLEEKDRLHHIEGTFTLVRCRQCGLMYLNPRPTPEEMVRYYPQEYMPYTPACDHPSPLLRLDRRYGQVKRRRAVIARAGKPGRILDVGCAAGLFLDEMRRAGWESYGVEINEQAARYGQERLGLNISVGTLREAAFPDRFFNVVTLWNVLEHLHRPQETLTEIARITRPDGWLIVTIPNPDSIEARLFGPCWLGWDAPRHLYIYTQETLGRALERAGFTPVEVASFTGRHSVLALSMDCWLEERWGNGRLVHWAKRAIHSIPARLLTLPYYLVVDRWNQSSVMTVFARRHIGGAE